MFVCFVLFFSYALLSLFGVVSLKLNCFIETPETLFNHLVWCVIFIFFPSIVLLMHPIQQMDPTMKVRENRFAFSISELCSCDILKQFPLTCKRRFLHMNMLRLHVVAVSDYIIANIVLLLSEILSSLKFT